MRTKFWLSGVDFWLLYVDWFLCPLVYTKLNSADNCLHPFWCRSVGNISRVYLAWCHTFFKFINLWFCSLRIGIDINGIFFFRNFFKKKCECTGSIIWGLYYLRAFIRLSGLMKLKALLLGIVSIKGFMMAGIVMIFL